MRSECDGAVCTEPLLLFHLGDTGRVEPPEDYDDAVTAGPIADNVEGVLLFWDLF